MIRKPAVAGAFYPGSQAALQKELEHYITYSTPKKKVIGLISPHAGYIYSGGCAGKGFGAIIVPGKVIILGVNHHGMGHPYAVDGSDFWNTPLGDIPIDTQLRDQLTAKSEIFEVDSVAGIREHSLEVQVPFIQTVNPNAKILPITISSVNVDKLKAGGREIARLIQANDPGSILIVASTDMSHYIDAELAKRQDNKAIHKIETLDPDGLFNTVASERISMCGVAPTVMMLAAAIECGAAETDVIEYTHSGKVSGDYHQVVAYLSMVVY